MFVPVEKALSKIERGKLAVHEKEKGNEVRHLGLYLNLHSHSK